MSETFTRVLAGLLSIIGSTIVGYVAIQIPPYQSSGALDLLAVAFLFVGLLIGITGICTLLAQWTHRRWPGLSGVNRLSTPNPLRPLPVAALRQGLLCSLSLCAIMLFSMLQILDSIFIFVIFLLAGLIETYFQSLQRQV